MHKKSPLLSATLAVIGTMLVCGCQSLRQTPIDDASSREGLVRVDVPGIDAVYRKPKAQLSGYTKILLRPVDIQFSKNWEKNMNSGLYRMDPPDREKIKSDLSEIFTNVFKHELETDGHYQLVSQPGEDVLEVRPSIIDLYITAPDVMTAGRVKTYTTDAGQMTLVAELHDSLTGELLSRAYDHKSASVGGTWQWTTSVSNRADAERIIGQWADALRKTLDASRSVRPAT